MEVIWSKSAKQDLIDYHKNSRVLTQQKINTYIISLLEYVDSLVSMPKLGKVVFKVNDVEVRQVIYQMHRILYSLINDKVYILVVSHTARDYKEIVKYIRNYLKTN